MHCYIILTPVHSGPKPFHPLMLEKISFPQNTPCTQSGFGGLEVACWPLVPKFAGLYLAEAVGFLGQKNPQHAFLRRGSKAVGPTS
jgi:hypothetical protein